MSAYFITGSGTGVGKTFTTCALLHAANLRGVDVRGFKPVISGWDESAACDTAQIIAAGGGHQGVDEVSPQRFVAALSPHRAALLEHKKIDIPALVEWTCALRQEASLTLIETIGGVMVPLTDRATTLDWMAVVKLPVIMVTGSYLGTISHTLTALAALRSRGLTVAALVLNETDGSAVTLAEAQAGLAPFIADIPLRIAQPLVSSWRAAADIHALGETL